MPAAPVRGPIRRRQDLPLIKSSPGIGPIVILIGLVVMPVGLAVTVDGSAYDTWGAFIWGPVLVALAFPLCRRVANKTGEPQVAGFLFGAAVLKIIVGSVVVYYVNFSFYKGQVDANRYDDAAAALVGPLRRGVFEDLGEISGTRFLEVLTGVVQAVIGETRVGSFVVFSFFGFVGLCLLYIAFCEAMPTGDRQLYRRLIFLTPTMWFWPSAIGKEAFLLMCVGGVALGAARLFAGRVSGLVIGGLGMWGTVVVRPHMALVLMAGLLVGMIPESRRDGDVGRPFRRSILAVVLPLVALVWLPLIASSVESFFGLEDLSLDSAQEVRAEVETRTGRGGSEFVPPDTNSFGGMAAGVATVIARPFPWEANGVASLFSAAETVALGGIGLVAIARRRALLVGALRQRWPRMAIASVLTFAWGFSVVTNFGIVVRQRSLMLPFLFVLLAAVRRPGQTSQEAQWEARPSMAATTRAQLPSSS